MISSGISSRFAIMAVAVLISNIALSSFENPLQTHLANASKYIDREDYKKALALYKGIEPSLTALSDTLQARIYNNMGFCAFKLGKFGEAATYYRYALERNNGYVICLNNMAVLLMGQKKFQDAIIYLKRADTIDAHNIKVLFNLTVCFGHLRNEREALSCLRRAFNLDEQYTYRRLKSRFVSDKEIRKLRDQLETLERAGDENSR